MSYSENDIVNKILNEEKLYNFLEVDTLLEIFNELNITHFPNSIDEISKKTKELGNIPKLLKEYFLKIGSIEKRDDEDDDYNLLEDSTGCYINDLDQIYILTSEMLKEKYGNDAENEQDDYLIFGFEMISSEEFGIKLKDIDQENPNIFSSEDLDGIVKEKGKVFDVLESTKTLKEFFALAALSVYEA